VTGARDVYDAPTFAHELDVELDSKREAGEVQHLPEENLNQ